MNMLIIAISAVQTVHFKFDNNYYQKHMRTHHVHYNKYTQRDSA